MPQRREQSQVLHPLELQKLLGVSLVLKFLLNTKNIFSGSTSIPNQVNPERIASRTGTEFSPIPAVKTSASAPFKTAKY